MRHLPPNMALQRPRRPRLRSGRSLRSLGSPLNARPLDGAKWKLAIGPIVAALAAFLGDGQAAAQEADSGSLVYGSNYAFLAPAPKGWVGQCPPRGSEGPAMMYWPADSSWKDSPVVMYINVLGQDESGARNLAAFINWELAEYRKTSPKLVVKSDRAIQVSHGRVAEVRRIQDGRGNRELVAYIQEPSVFSVFVLSARTEAALKRGLSAFHELVKGYSFLTDRVEIK